MKNASPSAKNQYSTSGAPVSSNDGELTAADNWPATPRTRGRRADSRRAAALKAATAKAARLEQQLAERDKRIGELERQLARAASQAERLETKLAECGEDNEAAAEDFERLCVAVDDYFYSIRLFPIALQLEFEAVAERVGARRTW